MTHATNARIAGITFLLYIAIGLTTLSLFGRASGGLDITARLDAIATHATPVRITILLGFLTGFVALALSVALYALTRTVDPDLALLALSSRIIEAVMAAVSTITSCALLALATNQVALSPDMRTALGGILLKSDSWFFVTSATAFAVGSTLFTVLLLRGRIVPLVLAWLGVVASIILVILLPVQLLSPLPGWVLTWMWIPMLFFEVLCGIWLIVTGARSSAPSYVPPGRSASA